MAEIRGLVKLFGKTIPVPVEVKFPPVSGEEGGGGGGGGGGTGKVFKDTLNQKNNTTESKEKDQPSEKSDDRGEPPATPEVRENQNPTHDDQEAAMPGKTSKLQEQDDAGSSNSQEKTLKKPDKILPCPRCDSLDTKFCYYNNYNVNQPRHFCKNCQRYWTAGGTMRNVPVGAGRRKNKSSSSHYRHLMTVSEASLQAVHCDISQVKTNGTVLSFGSDMQLCESMASMGSALNLAAEKTMRNQSTSIGFHHPMEEHTVPFSRGGGEKGEEHRSQPSPVTATDSITNREGCGSTPQEPATQSRQGYPLQIPYFNGGSPWPPHPWNAAPAFCASGIPISFYPATAYWGCAVPGGAWTVPCFSPVSSSPTPPPPNTGGGSSPNSPLGKHSRDGCVLKPCSLDKKVVGDAPPEHTNQQDGCIWVPKTLRIDVPDEAARSSTWATKGIKKADGVSNGGGGGMFKAFHPKAESKNHVSANSHFLYANPAALSRSLNFQEGLY